MENVLQFESNFEFLPGEMSEYYFESAFGP